MPFLESADFQRLAKWGLLAPTIVVVCLAAFMMIAAGCSWMTHVATTEEVSFRSGKLTLRGTLWEGETDSETFIVLCHGNRPEGRHHLLYLSLARLLSRRYSVLSIDFRGFNESDKPSAYNSLKFTEDIAAAVQFLQGRFDVPLARIVLIGHSLGALQVLSASTSVPVGLVIALGPGDANNEMLSEEKRGPYADKIMRNTGIRLSPDELLHAVGELRWESILSDCADIHRHLFFAESEHALRDVQEYLEEFAGRCPGTPLSVTTIASTDHMYGTEEGLVRRTVDRLGDLFVEYSGVARLAGEIERAVEGAF